MVGRENIDYFFLWGTLDSYFWCDLYANVWFSKVSNVNPHGIKNRSTLSQKR